MLSVDQLREVLEALGRAGEILQRVPEASRSASEQRLAHLVDMARREVRLELSESSDPWSEEEDEPLRGG